MTPARLARRALQAWNCFFHGPDVADARVLALLRIGFGFLVFVHVLAQFPYVTMLWTDAGVLPLERLPEVAGGLAPTVFWVLPRSTWVPEFAFLLLGVHAVLLALGYRTRVQAVLVLFWLVSFQNRNPLVTNGQDALLRAIGFFLLFLPSGAAWSLDARLGAPPIPRLPAWPLRLVQLQVSFVMLSAALWKLLGSDWTDGTALHYVTRLHGFWGNLPLPAFLTESVSILTLGTYLTLGLELALPIAIWVPSLRVAALAVAVGFHLALAYTMNLFLFPWVMILGWCSFLRGTDLAQTARALSFSPLRAARLSQLLLQRIRS